MIAQHVNHTAAVLILLTSEEGRAHSGSDSCLILWGVEMTAVKWSALSLAALQHDEWKFSLCCKFLCGFSGTILGEPRTEARTSLWGVNGVSKKVTNICIYFFFAEHLTVLNVLSHKVAGREKKLYLPLSGFGSQFILLVTVIYFLLTETWVQMWLLNKVNINIIYKY